MAGATRWIGGCHHGIDKVVFYVGADGGYGGNGCGASGWTVNDAEGVAVVVNGDG
jgi:hypothetical protein